MPVKAGMTPREFETKVSPIIVARGQALAPRVILSIVIPANAGIQ
jgi:hypothetical protein